VAAAPPPAAVVAPPAANNTGFGFDTSVPPPPIPFQQPKVDRNPTPSALDISTMLANAQKHMKESLNTKLQSIGFPPNISGPLTEPEMDIPLPIDMPGFPEPTIYGSGPVYQPPTQYTQEPDIPVPASKPPSSVNNSYAEADCLPPGEGPDPDDLALLGIDPSDSII